MVFSSQGNIFSGKPAVAVSIKTKEAKPRYVLGFAFISFFSASEKGGKQGYLAYSTGATIQKKTRIP